MVTVLNEFDNAVDNISKINNCYTSDNHYVFGDNN